MKYVKSFRNIIIYSYLSNLDMKFRKNFITSFLQIWQTLFHVFE